MSQVVEEILEVIKVVLVRRLASINGNADKDVQGEVLSKYSSSDGKKTLSICNELDGLDDVAEAAFKAESGERNDSLVVASAAGKRRTIKLTSLANEITGVKVLQKKGKT